MYLYEAGGARCTWEIGMHRDRGMASLALVFLVLSGASKLTASPQAVDPPAAPGVAPAIPILPVLSRAEGESQQPPGNLPSESPASHHFHWAPDSPQHAEVGVNFGLLQLGLGGFN